MSRLREKLTTVMTTGMQVGQAWAWLVWVERMMTMWR